MKLLSYAIAAVAYFYATSFSTQAHDASARYIGNEGVMVVQGETKVLFDAFYEDSYDRYFVPSAETYAALNEGRAPYDGVDAVFVSHVHGDHFSPSPMIDYLRAQPNVRVYGPEQMIDILREAGADDAVMARVITFDNAVGDTPEDADFEGLDIDVVAIPHAGGERMAAIRNLVFRVNVNDQTTVMHLGDSDPKESHFAPYQDHWDAKPLDAAFPPYWFYSNDEGRRILEERLKAHRSIGVHVPAEAIGQGDAMRADVGGDLFTDPGETRAIGGKE